MAAVGPAAALAAVVVVVVVGEALADVMVATAEREQTLVSGEWVDKTVLAGRDWDKETERDPGEPTTGFGVAVVAVVAETAG